MRGKRAGLPFCLRTNETRQSREYCELRETDGSLGRHARNWWFAAASRRNAVIAMQETTEVVQKWRSDAKLEFSDLRICDGILAKTMNDRSPRAVLSPFRARRNICKIAEIRTTSDCLASFFLTLQIAHYLALSNREESVCHGESDDSSLSFR